MNAAGICFRQPFQTSPALLRSSPARSERTNEICIDEQSLAPDHGFVNVLSSIRDVEMPQWYS